MVGKRKGVPQVQRSCKKVKAEAPAAAAASSSSSAGLKTCEQRNDNFEDEKPEKKTRPKLSSGKKKEKEHVPQTLCKNSNEKRPKSKVKEEMNRSIESQEFLPKAGKCSRLQRTPLKKKTDAKKELIFTKKEEDEDEESEEEWEDVEELCEPEIEMLKEVKAPKQPNPTVEIEIETPEQAKKREKREKRQAEFEIYLRRMLKRFSKEVREDTHKVHLLCLLANGFHRNRICLQPDLQAVGLSIIPIRFTKDPVDRINRLFLSNLVNWFSATFTINNQLSDSEDWQVTLERRFAVYAARDEAELVQIFLLILRALHLMCRLVLSLQPIPLKEPPRKGKSSKKSSVLVASGTLPDSAKSTRQCTRADTAKKPSLSRAKRLRKKSPTQEDIWKDIKSENDEKILRAEQALGRPKNDRRRQVASKVSYKEESGDSEDNDSEFCPTEENDDTSISDEDFEIPRKKLKSPLGTPKTTLGTLKTKAMVNRKRSVPSVSKRHKDSEIMGSSVDKTVSPCSSNSSKKKNKIISSDEEEEQRAVVSRGTDHWVEVFLEREDRWVCVDCIHGNVGHPLECFKYASKPVCYIIGIDNSGFVKDVTQRYDPGWMTATRKCRVDAQWWEETLEPYKSSFVERDAKEEREFLAKLQDQPLPKSISEYKNHPLYALKRHLLKYEAIYPETASILGYCRGEAVYSRDCIHTLHSKDTWLKQARVVRIGEVPYKMVKGYSNQARKARMAEPANRDKMDLPLFGLWQTEKYQPPLAVDGRVPRNEFGNVYLFQPCMLPIGCVQLNLPSLHRVARKLDIDCVPAVTGFDFHGGYSHPVTEGYIICEEYKEVLVAAWENEESEREKKEKEKREKRVLGNWKLMVKGLLIKERLKKRYSTKNETRVMMEGESGFSSDDEEGPNSETPAEDVAVSWPQNRQAEEQGGKGQTTKRSKREKKGEAKHLFPFEKL
ncbi:DNA repair protein complementing XP-C cells isoform X2 [Pseudonaja textilis]|uniref:DNA repair protein complementing XP-C cells isoform X2 n=1 Tax=Pseudonaja textilis TaxID=8673 RepID=UPI000EA8B524|nr:DNA repair protein complementing XP-C cells isoform X2 [Pseudonaja textilis]